MSTEYNNWKAGVFDYLMLIIGCGILLAELKLIVGGSFSFLSEDFDGPDGPLPGFFVLLLGFVAFYYLLKR
jgi:hypothetical protein